MPASITLSALTFSTPDGTSLFSDLDLTFGPMRTGLVGRTGKTTLLRLVSGDLVPTSGAIACTGTLGLMHQNIETCDTVADLFAARAALNLLARAEAGQADADELADADWTLPARIEAALARVGLVLDAQTRLETLSGGQQTRAALAALVFAEPDFLLLDEPTNNLDSDGRRAVLDLLRSWRNGAIIVSHDRELLEEMDAIVELTSLDATRYGGNYSAYRRARDQALAAAQHDLAIAEKTSAEIAARKQKAAERKARKDSAGKKSRTKGDQPKILMDFAKERAQSSGGSNARLRETREAQAQSSLAADGKKSKLCNRCRWTLPPPT